MLETRHQCAIPEGSMPLASRPLIASSLLAVAWIAAAACGRTAYPGLFSNCEGSTGILPVSPKHRLEACATPFVSNPRYSGADEAVPHRSARKDVAGFSGGGLLPAGLRRGLSAAGYGGMRRAAGRDRHGLHRSGDLGVAGLQHDLQHPRAARRPAESPCPGFEHRRPDLGPLRRNAPSPLGARRIRRAPICAWSCRSARN